MKHGICKLCRQESDLQRSHFLGKAVYRLMYDGELPIFSSTALVVQDQKQIADYLLCRSCEQRFSRSGEEYAMTLVNRENNEFKLMQLIRDNRGERGGDYTWYRADVIGVKTGDLAYFALSVIWRGTHAWPAFRHETVQFDLGQHEEPIRRYLLGTDPFPTNVIVKVYAATDMYSQESSYFPAKDMDHTGAIAFTFMVRGIWFHVIMGDPLPASSYNECCLQSPYKPIFVGDFSRFVQEKFENDIRQAAQIRVKSQ